MSVDRMTYGDRGILLQVHTGEAANRGDNRSFYGWYVFPADLVRATGLEVIPSEATDKRNIWHADVIIPDSETPIVVYANAISSEAEWEPKPLNDKAKEDIEQVGAG